MLLMPKRPAPDGVGQTAALPSPSAKRARLDDELEAFPMRNRQQQGAGPNEEHDATFEIAAAAEAVHQELQESGALVSDASNGRGRGQLGENTHQARHDYPLESEDMRANGVQRKQTVLAQDDDLYLDTINRAALDFDFEKLCSVSLSNINVYACLVCGKYFQGRGLKSQAYFHALDEGHHVFINMQSKKVFVLPEGYEVKSKSLDDIKFVVDPRLPKESVQMLDKVSQPAWDLAGKRYIPGFIGMNNIKSNDYLNAVIQLLSHVRPLRNFFMLENLSTSPQLVQRFSTLVRKIWNPRSFKAHVSPHELLQEITLRSNKKFNLTEQADPVDFLSWFLNNLHFALGGSRSKPGTSIIQHVFQGRVQVESQAITARADAGDRLRFEDADVQISIARYLLLTLDLPAAPLFQDEMDKNIIPQVALTSILSKYDGICTQEQSNIRRRYRLLHPLPPFLLLHVKRFSTNKFVAERNPTIVTFTPTSLDMASYTVPDPSVHPPGQPVLYDLVANITHEAAKVRDDSVEGEAEQKIWRCQVLDRAGSQWFEMQDLFVQTLSAETLFTKESYVQVWERRRSNSDSRKHHSNLHH